MAACYWVLLALWSCLANLRSGEACPTRCISCSQGVAECSQRSLVAPPRDFPEDVRTINLDGNHLRVLGRRSFQSLTQLEVLRMKGNKLRAIKRSSFKDFPNLMTLDLSNNHLVIIELRGLEGIEKLRTLSLQHNKLRSMAQLLDTTPNLYQLNVGFNSINAIGKNDLKTPTRLHYLDLRHNLITNIHQQAFAHLKQLRYLFLNNNPLVSPPPMTFGSNVLQLIDLSNCKLTHVPHTMPASITEFRLSDNNIMQINDKDFMNTTHLRLLALNDNELHFVANNAFTNLPHLAEIWLRNNKLVYIPRGLPDNLHKLYMDSNRIQEIEDALFSNKSQLNYLTVENNKIHRISNKTFSGLSLLKSINLRGNLIQTIETGTFNNLGNLSTLSLSDNPLQKVQKGAFQALPNLTHLHLSMCGERTSLEQNFLPEMPRLQLLSLMNSPGLAKAFVQQLADLPQKPLPHLKELDLTYSDLTTLTASVREVFPQLQTLALDGNSWSCDQRLAWLQEWMTTSDIHFWKYEEVMCEYPDTLKGRLLKNLHHNEFNELTPPQEPPPANPDLQNSPNVSSKLDSEDIPAASDQKFFGGNETPKQPEVLDGIVSLSQPVTTASVPTTTSLRSLRKKRKYRQNEGRRRKERGKKDKEVTNITSSTTSATTTDRNQDTSTSLDKESSQKNPRGTRNKPDRKGRKSSGMMQPSGKSKKKGKTGKGKQPQQEEAT